MTNLLGQNVTVFMGSQQFSGKLVKFGTGWAVEDNIGNYKSSLVFFDTAISGIQENIINLRSK